MTKHKYRIVVECACGSTHTATNYTTQTDMFFYVLQLMCNEHIKDFFVYEDDVLIGDSLVDPTQVYDL